MLYQALGQSGLSKEDAYAHMRSYMLDRVGAEKHAATAKLEAVPGFYFLYSRIFLHIMRTTDLQESTQARGRGWFDVTIRRCLWYSACVGNGCPELCRLFCGVDDVTYGGLKKAGLHTHENAGLRRRLLRFSLLQKVVRRAAAFRSRVCSKPAYSHMAA